MAKTAMLNQSTIERGRTKIHTGTHRANPHRNSNHHPKEFITLLNSTFEILGLSHPQIIIVTRDRFTRSVLPA